MNKKNLIIISGLTLWSMGKGNGGPAFTKTIAGYMSRGWNVYLISDEESNKDSDVLDAQHNIVIKSLPIKKYINARHVGFVFRWINHYLISKRFIAAANKILRALDGEAVIYAYEIYGVNAAKEISRKGKIPFVTRFQGTVLTQFDYNFINRIRLSMHFNALKQQSDLVIMTDDGTMGDKVLKELGNKSKLLFLRNGLDLIREDVLKEVNELDTELFRKEIGVNSDDCMFLTVSRLEKWKHVERAIIGFSEFKKGGGTGKLVIVGDGSEKENLLQLARDRNVDTDVSFIGAVSHDMVYKFLKSCDVFLSLYDISNVGNPLLEAMTIGKCIITLDVGDTNKIIKNRENGFLLSHKELDDLPSIMGLVSKDCSLREELAKHAETYAKKNFYDWETRMNIEVGAVNDLLSKS